MIDFSKHASQSPVLKESLVKQHGDETEGCSDDRDSIVIWVTRSKSSRALLLPIGQASPVQAKEALLQMTIICGVWSEP